MKISVGFKTLAASLLLVLLIAWPAPTSSNAQNSNWSAAIAYFNPTGSSGELSVSYHLENGSLVYPETSLVVNPHYSGTLLVSGTQGMEGAAVINTNFEMPAVYRIADGSGNPYGVIMLEFFNNSQVGLGTFYMPLVHHNTSGYISRIGIQNVETGMIDATLTFISDAGVTYNAAIDNIEPQSSEVFKTTEISTSPALPANFRGSLLIRAVQDGTSTGARIVAAAADIDSASNHIRHSFQGVKDGSTSVYLPLVYCQFGRAGFSSSLNIQNVSGASIDANRISISYYDGSGALVTTQATNNPALVDGQSLEVNVCTAGSPVNGRQLSAVVNSPASVAVVGEITDNYGLHAAYASAASYTTMGSNGFYNLTLPYVERSSSAWDFQTSIYIMNTSTSVASVTAIYYRRDSSSAQMTYNIPPLAMVETNPDLVPELVNMENRDFKGAVMLNSNQPIMALVLVTRQFQNADGSIMMRGDSYMGFQYLP